MNKLVVDVLTNPDRLALIRQKLPPAFEMVEKELHGNPAVGLLREQVIIGMFIAFLGESKVEPEEGGVQADIDCRIGGLPLSIKTVTAGGGIRIKWTANAIKAREFMRTYEPQSDLLVIRIAWYATGHIRYIPLAVQSDIFARLGPEYLSYSGATNTRGINLSSVAETAMNAHSDVVSILVPWRRTQSIVSPYKKWVDYWKGTA